jgi:tetratricopeptide (TPR) repeat protein
MKKSVLFIIVLIIVSCNDREKKSNQNEISNSYKADSLAIELNNKAISLISDAAHMYDSLSIILYDSAIVFLDRAIEIDSLYLLAYTNKAQVLQRKGSLEEALKVLKQVETRKPDFAEVITAQGFILEKIGRMELADRKYRQALKAYEERLDKNPMNDKVQSDISFLYIFLEDKKAAMDEIQKLIVENPNSEQLKMMESVIKDFDREKFIEEY